MIKRVHVVIACLFVLVAVAVAAFVGGAPWHSHQKQASAEQAAARARTGHARAAAAGQRQGADAEPLAYRGIVVSLAEEPEPEARVTVRALDDGRELRTQSNENGEFSYERLPAGRYVVSASLGARHSAPILIDTRDHYATSVLVLREPAEYQVEVRDARSERPLPAARVLLTPAERASFVTDERGSCALGLLKPGRYMLEVEAEGYASALRPLTVRAGAGAPELLRVRLTEAAGMEGTVYGPNGAPLVGACVRARSVSSIEPALPDAACERGLSDAQGHFALRDLAAGVYAVSATKAGLAPARATHHVEAGQTRRDVALSMQAAAHVAGVVQDAQGKPIQGARIALTPRSSGYGSGPKLEALSRADGRFVVPDLNEGEYVLEASSQRVTAPARLVTLAPAAALELVVRLTLASTISGRVVDAGQQPIQGAELRARLVGRSEAGDHHASSSADGAFELAGLPAGRYEVWASWPGARTTEDSARAIVESGGSTTLTLNAPGSLRGLALCEGATLTGGFEVLVDGRLAAQGRETGEFEVEALPAGQHTVTLRGPQFEPVMREGVEVRSGQETDLGTVPLSLGMRIVGKTLDARGAPVAGAEVVVANFLAGDATSVAGRGTRESSSFKTAESDASGRFSIEGVQRRGLMLVAEHPVWGRSRALSLSETQPGAELVLTLHPGSELRGAVRVDGKPASGVLVMVGLQGKSSAADGSASLAATTDAAGSYVIERVPAGVYQATALVGRAESGMKTQQQSVSLSAGKPAVLDFELQSGGVVLTVEAPSAQAYSATASLSGSGGVHTGQVRSQVPLRLEGVAPGVYTLCVRRHGPAGDESGPPCRQVQVGSAAHQTLRLWS